MSRILLVDDKENIRTVMGAVLRREGFEVDTAEDGKAALSIALGSLPDLILSDVRMDGMSGSELFRELRRRGISVPFVFMTAYANVPDAVEAIRDGAVHYLMKPVDYPGLLRIIRKAVSREAEAVRPERSANRRIIGSGPALRKLLTRVEAVASSDATVLIRGENGTGKELAARAIHCRSPRREGPFVPVHCAALNPNLLESELFGYEPGAFTGAAKRKDGYIEAARGGTLFLDEISEIGPETQVKLLRVLQEWAYSRVGGTELVKADFRLLAATNRDLETLVSEGSFRSDLYYRLDVVPLRVPPLRDRTEDIPELVEHFAARIAQAESMEIPNASPDFLEALQAYSWPGNVRELENLLERLIVLYRPRILETRLLSEEAPDRFGSSDTRMSERDETLDALARAGGNKSAAARLLGISRRALYYRLERLLLGADAPQGPYSP